jgi:haloacetate dehalogenase
MNAGNLDTADGGFLGAPRRHRVNRTAAGEVIELCARTGGAGPPLLLLHGFPQTHAMWRRVALQLAAHFTLVCADLRGYGDSTKPADSPAHAEMSKRALAADVHALMRSLGHERFGVVAHDRGARVAHRLALDHPEAVLRLLLIDIVPTLDMYERTDRAFATAYYHWFHLIQPAPLPERMIAGDGRFYLHRKLAGWGTGGLAPFEPAALAAYERAFAEPATVHAMCEDYRASAGIDLEHDRASRAAGEKIACPLHVLWGERGVIQRLFEPLALWQAQCAGPVTGRALPAGHYLAEELPQETAREVLRFFGAGDGTPSPASGLKT